MSACWSGPGPRGVPGAPVHTAHQSHSWAPSRMGAVSCVGYGVPCRPRAWGALAAGAPARPGQSCIGGATRFRQRSTAQIAQLDSSLGSLHRPDTQRTPKPAKPTHSSPHDASNVAGFDKILRGNTTKWCWNEALPDDSPTCAPVCAHAAWHGRPPTSTTPRCCAAKLGFVNCLGPRGAEKGRGAFGALASPGPPHPHPPPYIRTIFLRLSMKFTKEARNWRSIFGTQTHTHPHTHREGGVPATLSSARVVTARKERSPGGTASHSWHCGASAAWDACAHTLRRVTSHARSCKMLCNNCCGPFHNCPLLSLMIG